MGLGRLWNSISTRPESSRLERWALIAGSQFLKSRKFAVLPNGHLYGLGTHFRKPLVVEGVESVARNQMTINRYNGGTTRNATMM